MGENSSSSDLDPHDASGDMEHVADGEVHCPHQRQRRSREHYQQKRIFKFRTFDGSTPIETHLMKFRNYARFGEWSSLARVAALRHLLEGEDALLMTDVREDASEKELINILRMR